METTTEVRPRQQRAGIAKRLGLAGQGFALTFLMIPELFVVVAFATATSLLGVGVGLLLTPPAVLALRAVADLRRSLARRWQDTEIASPYRPTPEFRPGFRGTVDRTIHYLAEPATWRDLLWTLADPTVVLFTATLPLAFVLEGVYGFVISIGWNTFTSHGFNDWYAFVHVTKGNTLPHWSTAAVGGVLIVLGLWCAPAMMRVNARWTRAVLAPTARAELSQRVEHLTTTRHDAVDAQAAEIRRIERDLHDGAQARLVAMGMNLNAAARLLEKNPDAARALLLQARDASAKALNELRDLVRGIHPPILADRGLGDAVRAVALDSPLDVQVSVAIPDRLAAPIESAAYFAVNEVLTNAAKHSAANHVWVDLRHENGVLTMTVTDDGLGGADTDEGTGLRGIERRLATFDGIVAVSSPIGGPTVVTMELPCESSSPRTSSS